MIPMLKCLFCKRKCKLLKIDKIYGQTDWPITSYIISFFGDVGEYLKPDDGICFTCVFLLNKLIYIKNFMFKKISGAPESVPYVSFSTAYKLFLHNLDRLRFDEDDIQESPEDPEDDDDGSMNLLKATRASPDIPKSNSRERNTPHADREVEAVFRPKRRRRRRKTYERSFRRTRSVSRALSVTYPLERDHNLNDGRVSLHEYLAKLWCEECRDGRLTSLNDFVHEHSKESMTTFHRVDYNLKNSKPQPVDHTDFGVKILIQTARTGESPELQFHRSPVNSRESSVSISEMASTPNLIRDFGSEAPVSHTSTKAELKAYESESIVYDSDSDTSSGYFIVLSDRKQLSIVVDRMVFTKEQLERYYRHREQEESDLQLDRNKEEAKGDWGHPWRHGASEAYEESD